MKESKDTKLKEFLNENSALSDHAGFADQQMDKVQELVHQFTIHYFLAHYMMYESWMKNPYRPSFPKKKTKLDYFNLKLYKRMAWCRYFVLSFKIL